MDTLNELAKALANDANLATNIHNQIALKANITHVDGQLDLKANQITTYTKTEVVTSLGIKDNQPTTYTKTETGTALALTANQSTTYTKT